MDSKKKLVGLMALGLMVLGLGVSKGWSATTDSIQLLVTPGVTYSVVITSVNASGYNFGTVNLAATTQSTAPILVQNNGNTSAAWQLRINSLASGWTCVKGVADPTTTINQYEMRAKFTDTATGQPATFTNDTDDLSESALTNTTNGAEFESASATPDDVAPTVTRRLWLQLDMPDTSNQDALQKTFRLDIVAGASQP